MFYLSLLLTLTNLSFSQGTFPSKFKHSSVTPLHKKPGHDPTVLAHFRPISNLNNISKILERLFLTRLQPYTASSEYDSLKCHIFSHWATFMYVAFYFILYCIVFLFFYNPVVRLQNTVNQCDELTYSFNHLQSACRKHHSTETSLIHDRRQSHGLLIIFPATETSDDSICSGR